MMKESSTRRDETDPSVRSLGASGHYSRASRPISADRISGRTWSKLPTRDRLGWRDAPVQFFLRQFQVRNLTGGPA
jgi:hypothetical protein